MKYENASDVIPEELLKEVQKYAAGKLLYIPTGEEKKAWGETSGYRDQLQKRNLMIRNKYAHGVTVSELADEYFLSLDSVKKIIYSKKNDRHLSYAPTLESAVQYANVGMFEEWIQCYLLLTRKVIPILHDFMKEDHLYIGIVKFPLRLIQLDEIEIGEYHAAEDDDHAAAPPPLLVQYEEGKFHCIVQKKLLNVLKQRKVNAYPTIIVMKGNDDYKRFMKYYGIISFYVDKV
ncbi:CD3324 family protein [Paenibacillus glacialis]|uniref:CD3324 family protein n=1 Tax=Paenibacillus glacialis TaxID=494026 RepID=UPI0008380B5F|nr:CD3324 family protein [Paenibacillus glacialis]